MEKLEQILLKLPTDMLVFIDRFSQEQSMNRTAFIRKVLMNDIADRILACDRGIYRNRITFSETVVENDTQENGNEII